MVLGQPLPEEIQKAAELYAGCVAGALLKDEYLQLIQDQGFLNVQVQAEKTITVPDDVLARYMDANGIADLKSRPF